ncbi:MAG: bifunctional 23S rRNA (guanine(2069)-N(7))-methyltransferase RlmK/23S rRNA (guanine(2445)-N(2))-methyltransferase RlmL [Spirochaetales bacterium]|nr:bifunctional 23S rRNA (guanine(2069)-N(7))-methyltransferase RlmK/23S rRNA (guanine(2445)-N(2))-methyltransferase RlmL [Spirochaetales bacterium]
MPDYRYILTFPPDTDDLAEKEITAAGGRDITREGHKLLCTGTIETGYRLCLHSHILNRVYVQTGRADAGSRDSLYEGVKAIPWETIIREGATIGIHTRGLNSVFRHTLFTSQLAKDAVVDRVREAKGTRPDVDADSPGLALSLLVEGSAARICIDMSGRPLFKRGYRTGAGEAPLKENVAAAMLLRAKWPDKFPLGILADPMCGSGTLAIEGALLALGMAPGLLREYYGFFGWKDHDPELWSALKQEAAASAGGKHVKVFAWDNDPKMIATARRNIDAAGLTAHITLGKRDFFSPGNPVRLKQDEPGLLVMNPPYGIRLQGGDGKAEDFYRLIGTTLKEQYPGWKAAILASPPELGKALNIPPERTNRLKNGALDCALVHLELFSHTKRTAMEEKRTSLGVEDLDEGQRMLYNRLKKTRKALKAYLSREEVRSYRLYDKDIPEYGVAIDVYEDNWFHVQEYAPPKTVDPHKAQKRLKDVSVVLTVLFDIKASQVFVKTRSRMKGATQYTPKGSAGEKYIMNEGGWRFYVNFTDYLDTGIFLDHRIVRKQIAASAGSMKNPGSFLNLFCYTGTASVYAAKAGFHTTSVDSSATYLSWARDNFRLNAIKTEDHLFIQEGCFEWLTKDREYYDCILLDPPTFSNTKDARRNFDIQHDHIELLDLSIKRLKMGGRLFFSTNFRQFKPDFSALVGISVTETTAETVPEDFRRAIHRSFSLIKT